MWDFQEQRGCPKNMGTSSGFGKMWGNQHRKRKGVSMGREGGQHGREGVSTGREGSAWEGSA